MQKGSEYLTLKEIEVLSCLVNNVKRKQIAIMLDISENTIKYHIKNISVKLECNSQTDISYAAQCFFKLRRLNMVYKKLNATHRVRTFVARHSTKSSFKRIVIKTIFPNQYLSLQSIFSKHKIPFEIVAHNAINIPSLMHKILHISFDRIIVEYDDHKKIETIFVRNYDNPFFIISFFCKVFGAHNLHHIDRIKTTKYTFKKIAIITVVLSSLSYMMYRFHYSTKSIDHISPMIPEAILEKNHDVLNRINALYKCQHTSLKLLIVRGPAKSGKTFCARVFSADKTYVLKTEINASDENSLYNSLYSFAKLLAANNTYFSAQLNHIHSIPSDKI